MPTQTETPPATCGKSNGWLDEGVTLKCSIRRRLWPMTKKQYDSRKVSVGKVKKSIAAIASRCQRTTMFGFTLIRHRGQADLTRRATTEKDLWKLAKPGRELRRVFWIGVDRHRGY